MQHKIIFSGFGGQGVLTLGAIVADLALQTGSETTWFPSYGAEMRGGTANCSVVISNKKIASPMVTNDATILVAMNNPSLDKFQNSVVAGGTIILNTSIVTKEVTRDDVKVVKIDATNIANEIGTNKVTNIVMLGALNKGLELFEMDAIKSMLFKKFGTKKPELLEVNYQAIDRGYNEVAM